MTTRITTLLLLLLSCTVFAQRVRFENAEAASKAGLYGREFPTWKTDKAFHNIQDSDVPVMSSFSKDENPSERPLPSFLRGAMGWSDSQTLFLWGGADQTGRNYSSALWKYEQNGWEEVNTDGGPPARAYSQQWEEGERIWLFGGETVDSSGNDIYLSDLWVLNKKTLKWQQVESSSPPTKRGRSCGWIHNGELWLYGGYNGGLLDDLWIYDGKDWRQQKPVGELTPGKRYSAHHWSAAGKLWLWGGKTLSENRDNLFWCLDPATMEWKRTWGIPVDVNPDAFSAVYSTSDISWSFVTNAVEERSPEIVSARYISPKSK